MPAFPVRGLAQFGVISDASAVNIPSNAWTHARNARFVTNEVRRAPAFRTLMSSLLTTTPYFFAAVFPSNAPDFLVYTDQDGKVYRRTTTGLHADISATAHTDTATSLPTTATTLGENLVICRSTEQPWYIAPAGTQLAPLPGWDSTHTAVSVRAYKDFLIALNVSKGGVPYPNLVKTSDAALAGQMPQSWDQNDNTLLADEIPLNELTTPLIDGCTLGDDFILYTSDQVWKMSYRGDDFIYDFRNTPVSGGVINVNCVAKANSLHYVFGVNDIYAHDGVTRKSICDQRTRQFIFKYLDRSKVDRCFVYHDENASTVRFVFPSSDPSAYWLSPTQCNMSAAYNYVSDTWVYEDMPNVCGCALANPATVYSYATYPGDYADATDAYATVSETTSLIPVFATAQLASTASITARAYVHDLIADGARLPGLTLDSAITPPVILQKTSGDVHDLGLTIKHYKEIRTIVPQIDSDASFSIRCGGQMRVKDAITWDPYLTFDPSTDDQVDMANPDTGLFPGGRLVSIEFKFTSLTSDFSFTAYEVDLTATSSG